MKFNPFPVVFFTIFGAIVLIFVYRIARYGGFKAAMFGAKIERTVGEVEGTGQAFGRVRLRIHVLSGERDRSVGIELIATTIGSYQMLPITLSSTGTDELMALLQEAAASDRPNLSS